MGTSSRAYTNGATVYLRPRCLASPAGAIGRKTGPATGRAYRPHPRPAAQRRSRDRGLRMTLGPPDSWPPCGNPSTPWSIPDTPTRDSDLGVNALHAGFRGWWCQERSHPTSTGAGILGLGHGIRESPRQLPPRAQLPPPAASRGCGCASSVRHGIAIPYSRARGSGRTDGGAQASQPSRLPALVGAPARGWRFPSTDGQNASFEAICRRCSSAR
jgi:hypothetical protein